MDNNICITGMQKTALMLNKYIFRINVALIYLYVFFILSDLDWIISSSENSSLVKLIASNLLSD